jgi:hypothetical protein
MRSRGPWYDAAIRRKVMQLEAEYDGVVWSRYASISIVPDAVLSRNLACRAGHGSRQEAVYIDEYRQFLAALHPDSTVDSRTKMFILVRIVNLLRPPGEKPFTSSYRQRGIAGASSKK